jgi:aryl-alcohol dehydrogenase-like predicted oxidoreductase
MGGMMDRYRSDELLEAVQRLRPIAEDAGLSMATMALAWVLRRQNVASCIIGASRPEQVHHNAEAAAVNLGRDTVEAIDDALQGVTVEGPRLANFVAEGVAHR